MYLPNGVLNVHSLNLGESNMTCQKLELSSRIEKTLASGICVIISIVLIGKCCHLMAFLDPTVCIFVNFHLVSQWLLCC